MGGSLRRPAPAQNLDLIRTVQKLATVSRPQQFNSLIADRIAWQLDRTRARLGAFNEWS